MANPLHITLGQLPSGKVAALSQEQLGNHLRDRYLESDEEKARIKAITKRIDLFNDRTTKHADALIDKVFKHSQLRAEYKRFVCMASFQNVSRRLTQELSMVYASPATRRVGSDDDAYQDVLRAVDINTAMRAANEYVNLANEALVWFSIDADTRPKLHVLPQHRFMAVCHPLNPAQLVAIIFPIKRSGFAVLPTEPHWQVWSDYETFMVDGHNRIMAETYVAHGLGRMPGVLVHRRQPDEVLLDADSGGDIVSAHEATMLLNVLMIREMKVGTKLPYIAGDIGSTATGQPMDKEVLSVFQEGTAPGTLDLGADPRAYIQATSSAIKQVAANNGIPESVYDMSYQASSGFEIELKQTGLRERRMRQIMYPWRPAEHELADAMSAVLKKHKQGMAFDAEGFGIDFGEMEIPREPGQKLEVFKKRREMFLMTTLDMIMLENPELTEKQAKKKLESIVKDETDRLEMLRGLQAQNAGPNTQINDQTPAENGKLPFSQPRSGPPPRMQ